jgi:secreted trypsin-like serine protease
LAAVLFENSARKIDTFKLENLSNDLKYIGDTVSRAYNSVTARFIDQRVNFLPFEKCHEYYDANSRIRFGILDNELCTTPIGNERLLLDGSPLLKITSGKRQLIGIKSFQGPSGLPEVYTRLASYSDWIETVINDVK